MLPLIPIGIASLAGGAWWARRRRGNIVIDPRVQAEREVIFDTAMNTPMTVDKLKALADTFRKEGLTAHADMLEKRILLKTATPELKEARKEALRKGLASIDVPAICRLADLFEAEGAVGAAQKLREYAKGVADTKNATADEVMP